MFSPEKCINYVFTIHKRWLLTAGYTSFFIFSALLAEQPGVARGFLLAYNTPQLPVSVHKKFKPNRSSRLACYTQHIYECLVLLYSLLISSVYRIYFADESR